MSVFRVWFLGCRCLASCLLVFGFLVYWFIGLLVSCFRSSWHLQIVHFMFLDRYRSHIQDFRNFINRIFGFVGCPIFPTSTNFRVSPILRFRKQYFLKVFQECFVIVFRYPGVSKYTNSWCWGSWTRAKIPKSQK